MNVLLFKLSGSILETNHLSSLLCEIDGYCKSSTAKYIIVHGGGASLSQYSESLGYKPIFDKQGNRITSTGEMTAAIHILAGEMRSKLVHLCRSIGIPALGLCASDGSMVEATTVQQSGLHTGRIVSCNLQLLDILLANDYVPIINSIACDKQGKSLNINADDLACALAAQYGLEQLVFLSEVPGVLVQSKLVSHLDRMSALDLIEKKIIHSGMTKKIQMALSAQEQGVKKILIGDYVKNGDLGLLLNHKKGTLIHE